jgi:pimeloyl-ACP methyl ester carboxylesterase
MAMRGRTLTVGLTLLVAFMALGVSPCLGQSAAERRIVETEKPIEVDGKLEEWTGFEELTIDKTPEGRTLLPSADLTVTAQLTFNAEYFYAAVRVVDDELVFPERRLAEGDSLLITLVDLDPAGGGRQYSTYGFAHSRGEDIKILVSRNGKAFPSSFVKDILLKVQPDADRKSIVYEVAIPWSYIPDFRPFLQPVWGVNLTCVDYDQKTHGALQLVPDISFEEDISGVRRGAPFRFVPRGPKAPEFQSMLNANHYFPGDEKTLSLAVNSPADGQGWELRFLLSSAAGIVQTKEDLSFGPGLRVLSFPIEVSKPSSGLYDFSVGVLDDRGTLRFSDDKQFFLIEPPEFEAYAAKIADIKKGELYAKDAVFRESLPTLEVRVQWTEDFMKTAPPFGDIDSLKRWSEEMKELLRNLEAGKPALFPPGRPVTLGYRSPGDGSLRSYAVFIPEWYDPKLRFPLYVTLGAGEGDAEREVSVVQMANYGPRVSRKAGDLIILAPASGLAADWYTGDSEKEILASIDHLKKLYSVNDKAVILDGFDRGAYGALRLALLSPGLFRGLVLRSGRYIPPESAKGENVFDLLDRAKDLKVLVLHGDQDDVAPVAEAQSIVTRLQKVAGESVKFIEVKDGGHLDYSRWGDVFGWVKDVLGDAVVKTKPPKRERERREPQNPEEPGSFFFFPRVP